MRRGAESGGHHRVSLSDLSTRNSTTSVAPPSIAPSPCDDSALVWRSRCKELEAEVELLRMRLEESERAKRRLFSELRRMMFDKKSGKGRSSGRGLPPSSHQRDNLRSKEKVDLVKENNSTELWKPRGTTKALIDDFPNCGSGDDLSPSVVSGKVIDEESNWRAMGSTGVVIEDSSCSSACQSSLCSTADGDTLGSRHSEGPAGAKMNNTWMAVGATEAVIEDSSCSSAFQGSQDTPTFERSQNSTSWDAVGACGVLMRENREEARALDWPVEGRDINFRRPRRAEEDDDHRSCLSSLSGQSWASSITGGTVSHPSQILNLRGWRAPPKESTTTSATVEQRSHKPIRHDEDDYHSCASQSDTGHCGSRGEVIDGDISLVSSVKHTKIVKGAQELVE